MKTAGLFDLVGLTEPITLYGKVRDVVGLYLNPPDHAVVLCVDEKVTVQSPRGVM